MIYLVDGHNLIGKMPDIDLADLDDEAKLTRRLQSWSGNSVKRKVELFFDSGSLGGYAPHLSGLGVTVQFARVGQTADELIMRRLKKVRNAQAFTLVTSDREIIAVAKKRRVGYVLSEEFVALLALERVGERGDTAVADDPIDVDAGEAEHPELDTAEVASWLAVFGDTPTEPLPKLKRQKRTEAALPSQKEVRPASLAEQKEGAGLTAEELAEWLRLFGDGESGEQEGEGDTAVSKPIKPKPRKRGQPRKVKRENKSGGLSAEDEAAWHAFVDDFGQ